MKDLISIVVNPSSYFDQRRRPWLPLIATIVISLLGFLAIQFGLKHELMQKTLEYIQNLPEDQKEKALASLTNRNRIILFGALFIVILTPIKILIQSLIYSTSAPIMGKELPFMESLTITSSANFVSSLSLFVKVPIALLSKNPIVRTDLGVLFERSRGYFPIVLSQVDIFTLWSLFIIATGLQKYGNMKEEESYGLVFLLWLVYIFGIAPLLAIRRGF